MKGGKAGDRLLGSSEVVAIPNVCTYGCCPGGLLRLFKMLLEMHQPQREQQEQQQQKIQHTLKWQIKALEPDVESVCLFADDIRRRRHRRAT